jgi:UDP-glucose 4-epimerase
MEPAVGTGVIRMHVLVTGGAGFIGSHVVERHLAMGDHVHVVDDLSTGQVENIRPFLDHPKFRFEEADVLTWHNIEKAATWANRVYHLAAVVGVYRVISEPTKVLAVNIAACERLLRAIAHGGWKPQVVIASSSEVYGHNEIGLLDEAMDLRVSTRAGTRWNYSVSKIADEALGLSYARKYGIPVVLGRFFNTVGPRQTGRYGMVLPRFVAQAVRGEPITIYGSGEQTRSFCDVRDTVVALDLLAQHASPDGLVVNVGNDNEITIRQLAERVTARAQSHSPLHQVSYREAYGEDFEDIQRRRPVLTRLRELTGFQHHFSLDRTIDDLIAIARAQLAIKTAVAA